PNRFRRGGAAARARARPDRRPRSRPGCASALLADSFLGAVRGGERRPPDLVRGALSPRYARVVPRAPAYRGARAAEGTEAGNAWMNRSWRAKRPSAAPSGPATNAKNA